MRLVMAPILDLACPTAVLPEKYELTVMSAGEQGSPKPVDNSCMRSGRVCCNHQRSSYCLRRGMTGLPLRRDAAVSIYCREGFMGIFLASFGCAFTSVVLAAGLLYCSTPKRANAVLPNCLTSSARRPMMTTPANSVRISR